MGEYIERGYHAMALNEERKDFVSVGVSGLARYLT